MGLKINLNGSNFVSDRTRDAFEQALRSQPEPHQQHAEPKRDADNGNGGDHSASHSDALQPHAPAVADPQVDYQRIMESLDRGLAQSYQHQSETLRVHEQYLNNQAEYSRIFLQLMQQQGGLFSQGHASSNGGATTTHAVLESLARSIEQFHTHQSETLGMHHQFLNQQAEYASAFMDLLQEECEALTQPGLPAPRARNVKASKTEVHVPRPDSGPDNGDYEDSARADRPTEMNEPFSAAPVQRQLDAIGPARPLDRDLSARGPEPGNGVASSVMMTAPMPLSGRPMEEPTNGRGRRKAVGPSASLGSPETVAVPTDNAAEPSTGIDAEVLAQSLLDIVSEKTGYPTDILELSMDMEADLGIDSIKRVEILGALEDKHPELPEVDADALAELRTLGQIIDYMGAQGPGTVAAGDVKKNVYLSQAESGDSVGQTDRLTVEELDAVGQVTPLFPRPVCLKPLPPPDFLEFTLGDSSRMPYVCLITDDGGGLAIALAQALMQEEDWPVVLLRFPSTLIENTMVSFPSDMHQVTLDTMHEEHLAEQLAVIADTYGPVGALVHIHPVWTDATLDDVEQLSSLTLAPPSSEAVLSHVFLMAKHLKSSLQAAAQGERDGVPCRSCFVTVSQMDGALGLGQKTFKASSGLAAGGLPGLVKTLDREWGDVFCRAVDLAPDLEQSQAVWAVLAELHDPNRLVREVGYGPLGRVTIEAADVRGGRQA